MRIKEVRIQNGISQKELASIIGIAQNTLSQYENERRTPDFYTAARIADYFHVSVDYLIGRGKQEPIPGDEDGLSKVELRLLALYNDLNLEGQEKLLDYADDLVASGKYIKSHTIGMDKEA